MMLRPRGSADCGNVRRAAFPPPVPVTRTLIVPDSPLVLFPMSSEIPALLFGFGLYSKPISSPVEYDGTVSHPTIVIVVALCRKGTRSRTRSTR
jgi:hypothetical protein